MRSPAFRWQNGGMAHVPSSALTPYVRTKTIALTWTGRAKKYGLRDYGKLVPVLDQSLVKSWVGENKTDKHPEKQAQYLPDVTTLPNNYASRIICVTDNACAMDAKGNLLFIYVKTINGRPAIPERVREKALTGCRGMEFNSCDDSNRPELREANALQAKAGLPQNAGEFNSGWLHILRTFKMNQSDRNERRIRFILPLLRAFSGAFQKLAPFEFGLQNSRIKGAHRTGLEPYSTMTFLRSAPSAVHTDGKNGAGSMACMTTVAQVKNGKLGYSGGRLCFPEYAVEIAVQPGDLLIAATPKNWHCNLSAVDGEKFSIITYFKASLQRKFHAKDYVGKLLYWIDAKQKVITKRRTQWPVMIPVVDIKGWDRSHLTT
jgi:hypothetical protein